MKTAVAILCSDIHLSLTPPIARSVERDWLAAQGRVIDQLKEIQLHHSQALFVVAGDIFDRWCSSPELINWAIQNLPHMFAIPGQHDLPLHNYDDIKKSAYWTLVEAGKITSLKPNEYHNTGYRNPLYMHGIPWGYPIESPEPRKGMINLAVIHSYIWKQGKGFYGAPVDKMVSSYSESLSGYDVAVFGDNHNPFLAETQSTIILNCGCLIRRKLDEKEYKPQVGLLYDDGSVEIQTLDCTADQWVENEEEIRELENAGLNDFVEELKKSEADDINFSDEIDRYVQSNPVSKGAKELLINLLEK